MRNILIGLAVLVALMVGAITYMQYETYSDHEDAKAAVEQTQPDTDPLGVEHKVATDQKLHDATCELHKGDAAALKLHGCK
jgi:hypothetical protein